MNSPINIPTSWDQITVDQFLELQTIDVSQFTSEFYLMLEKLAIITNTSAEDDIWEEMDVIEVSKLIQSRLFLNHQPPTRYKTQINEFTAINFNQLTIGAFIDLNYYIDDIIGNYTKILSVFYRKNRLGDWGEMMIEPYKVIDKNQRAMIVEDFMITDVYGIVDAFIKWRNDFMNSFEALWEPDVQDEVDEEFLKKNPSLVQEIEKEKKEEAKHKKWAWIRLLYDLADGDVTKMTEVADLNLIHVMNVLAMKKELGLIG